MSPATVRCPLCGRLVTPPLHEHEAVCRAERAADTSRVRAGASELLGRARKVKLITDALLQALSVQLETASEDHWADIARLAGVKMPSKLTRGMVVAALRGAR